MVDYYFNRLPQAGRKVGKAKKKIKTTAIAKQESQHYVSNTLFICKKKRTSAHTHRFYTPHLKQQQQNTHTYRLANNCSLQLYLRAELQPEHVENNKRKATIT